MKFIKALLFALNGFSICLLSEINFRIHVVAAIAAAAAGIYFGLSGTEWMIVCICAAAVMITEMLNTSIEKLCGLVQPEFHPVIKQVKDIAAGAVLLAALASIFCGCFIFLPKILVLLKTL